MFNNNRPDELKKLIIKMYQYIQNIYVLLQSCIIFNPEEYIFYDNLKNKMFCNLI